MKASHELNGLLLEKSFGLGCGDKCRLSTSSSAIKLSLRLVLPARHLGEPDDPVERGDDAPLGELAPAGVGDPVRLRLKPRELDELPPGLPGLPGRALCSSRMRRSLRLLRRMTRGARDDVGDEAAALSSLKPQSLTKHKIPSDHHVKIQTLLNTTR